MWHMEIDESDIHNPQVVVFGDEQCRKRAGMQLEIHFKLQNTLHEKQGFIDARVARLQRYETSESYVFQVADHHCGLIIGPGGQNIKRVQKMYPGVEKKYYANMILKIVSKIIFWMKFRLKSSRNVYN